ncbi:hypothetical protein [Blastococcus sp. SYSU D00695]
MARPSIVPIALTLDDRTGYTLWAPPWEEDGEEWQAFLGTTEDDTARVHLFPSPAALASFCRTATDHDLADHPVWPVVTGLGAADLTPDDDHRYDLDGVYDVAADDPDRWAVEELAATIDIVRALAECLDTSDEDDDDLDEELDDDLDAEEDDDRAVDPDVELDARPSDGGGRGGQFSALAELVSRPEVGSLGLGVDAFAGRAGEDAWVGMGSALDELWEDVLEELSAHLDWTGAGTARIEDYPAASEARDDDLGDDDLGDEIDDDEDDDADRDARPAAGATATSAAAAPASDTPAADTPAAPGTSTIRGGSRITAAPAAVAAAAPFWEGVGILPVELVVPEGAGLTLRCYVEDEARFLGRDGEVFLFASPAELSRFCAGDEEHDLTGIASWPEVAATDVAPLPAEQDRYDLTELAEVLAEVADGAAGLVQHEALLPPVEGARDVAEYAGLGRVDELLTPPAPLGRALARADRDPQATLRAEDAAVLRADWDEVVRAVEGALVFRD